MYWNGLILKATPIEQYEGGSPFTNLNPLAEANPIGPFQPTSGNDPFGNLNFRFNVASYQKMKKAFNRKEVLAIAAEAAREQNTIWTGPKARLSLWVWLGRDTQEEVKNGVGKKTLRKY